MDFVEKESTESGSPVQTESPQLPLSSGEVVAPEPVAMNMPLSMSIESSLGVKVAPQGGGGGSSGVVGSGSGDLVMVTAGSGSVSGSAGRKKRGRPRKYDSEGNLRIPYIATGTGSPQPAFTLTSPTTSHSQHSSSSKRGRGRPPGSGNWQLLAPLGELFASTAGGDFTPHVVNVYTGEDVAGKILTFSQKGPRGMCVLSANGTVSNVTIRQPGSSGGLLTYEGRFEILSLTGSFTISENGGIRSRTGGLSVSLAGPDGRVIGGGVAGLLVAASPIQIVVGSFMPTGYKMTNKRRHNPEPRPGTVAHGVQDVVAEARAVSQATPQSHIFPTPTSDLPVAANGEADNGTSKKDNANSTSNLGTDYNGSGHPPYQRETPDINVCLSFEQQ